MNEKIPDCPHCDSTLKPERVDAGRYVCVVCSRIFTIPKSA